MLRKEGRRGLTNIQDYIDATIRGIHKKEQRLIPAASNSNVSLRANSKTTNSRKQKWEGKQFY